MLERPFKEVLESGQPDFPFCLGWANHSWEDKTFNKEGTSRVLMEQQYPGEKDDIDHFMALLPAFKDERYLTVGSGKEKKPIFYIFRPFNLPNAKKFISLWQRLALENGLNGIHFIGQIDKAKNINELKEMGFDAVNMIRLLDFIKQDSSIFGKIYTKIMRVIFRRGRIFEYSRAAKFFTGEEDRQSDCYPTLIPNWDHSPRSGRHNHILIHSTPQKFENHVLKTFENVIHKDPEKRIVFIKSWNEWAEGNYMEPDLKFGLSYLEALRSALNKFSNR